jgi:hypothetical protein
LADIAVLQAEVIVIEAEIKEIRKRIKAAMVPVEASDKRDIERRRWNGVCRKNGIARLSSATVGKSGRTNSTSRCLSTMDHRSKSISNSAKSMAVSVPGRAEERSKRLRLRRRGRPGRKELPQERVFRFLFHAPGDHQRVSPL